MLRIESLTLREIHLSLKEPFRISSGTQSRRRIVLVELRSADGVVGWGECAAGEFPNYSSETPDTCWLAIKEWVAPRVLGRTFAGPQEIQPVLDALISISDRVSPTLKQLVRFGEFLDDATPGDYLTGDMTVRTK